MVMMNLTRNDGTEPATFVTALRAPVEMAVTIEDSEDDRLLPALSTKIRQRGVQGHHPVFQCVLQRIQRRGHNVSYTCGSA